MSTRDLFDHAVFILFGLACLTVQFAFVWDAGGLSL